MPTDAPPAGSPWTVIGVLEWTAAYFKRHQLEHARCDADLLLAHALGCRRIDLYLRHDQPLHEAELARFKLLVQRRARREPVAYIVGEKEFWSLPLAVTPDVLIPRPDTECLVEQALALLPAVAGEAPRRVLDLGVGSGAITVALAHERSLHRFWASDASLRALRVARANARRHHVDHLIQFFAGRWLDPLAPVGQGFDLIVSNPPYVRRDEIARLAPEIRDYEPMGALDGGPQGLSEIAAIIAGAPDHMRPGARLLLEIGFDQRPAVEALAKKSGAYDRIDFHKDYAGHYRVAQMRRRG